MVMPYSDYHGTTMRIDLYARNNVKRNETTRNEKRRNERRRNERMNDRRRHLFLHPWRGPVIGKWYS